MPTLRQKLQKPKAVCLLKKQPGLLIACNARTAVDDTIFIFFGAVVAYFLAWVSGPLLARRR